jgi:hypothetical protein
MVKEFPQDKLTELLQEYRAKFGDYAPRYALHSEDPEALLSKAIKSDTEIPELPPGNYPNDAM